MRNPKRNVVIINDNVYWWSISGYENYVKKTNKKNKKIFPYALRETLNCNYKLGSNTNLTFKSKSYWKSKSNSNTMNPF